MLDPPTIIVDPGFRFVRNGFMHDKSKDTMKYREAFRSLFGSPRRKLPHRRLGPARGISDRRDYAIGFPVKLCEGVLDVYEPVEKGHVTNWQALRHIIEDRCEHISRKAECKYTSGDKHNLVLCEPCTATRREREDMISFVFEYMSPERFCPVTNAFCYLYGTKKTEDKPFKAPQQARVYLMGKDETTQFVQVANIMHGWVDRCTARELHENVTEIFEQEAGKEDIYRFWYEQSEDSNEYHPWSIWDGANKFANDIIGNESFWIKFDDYLENGPSIINFCN